MVRIVVKRTPDGDFTLVDVEGFERLQVSRRDDGDFVELRGNTLEQLPKARLDELLNKAQQADRLAGQTNQQSVENRGLISERLDLTRRNGELLEQQGQYQERIRYLERQLAEKSQRKQRSDEYPVIFSIIPPVAIRVLVSLVTLFFIFSWVGSWAVPIRRQGEVILTRPAQEYLKTLGNAYDRSAWQAQNAEAVLQSESDRAFSAEQSVQEAWQLIGEQREEIRNLRNQVSDLEFANEETRFIPQFELATLSPNVIPMGNIVHLTVDRLSGEDVMLDFGKPGARNYIETYTTRDVEVVFAGYGSSCSLDGNYGESRAMNGQTGFIESAEDIDQDGLVDRLVIANRVCRP